MHGQETNDLNSMAGEKRPQVLTNATDGFRVDELPRIPFAVRPPQSRFHRMVPGTGLEPARPKDGGS